MGQSIFDLTPQTLTVAIRGTGSFIPASISKTPYIGFQLIKDTTNASVDTLTLHTSNARLEWQSGSNIPWPSGSANEYLWYAEPDFTSATSGTLLVSPMSTGTAVGSVVYHVANLNARYARLTVKSNSGGVFRLIMIGKGGE